MKLNQSIIGFRLLQFYKLNFRHLNRSPDDGDDDDDDVMSVGWVGCRLRSEATSIHQTKNTIFINFSLAFSVFVF